MYPGWPYGCHCATRHFSGISCCDDLPLPLFIILRNIKTFLHFFSFLTNQNVEEVQILSRRRQGDGAKPLSEPMLDPFIPNNKHSVCWWLGDVKSQGINSHFIDQVVFQNTPVSAQQLLTHWGVKKMTNILQNTTTFSKAFLFLKNLVYYHHSNFDGVCSRWSTWRYVSISLSNGWASNRQQVTSWTDLV